MTSGGTESILMSMLVNRERALAARHRRARRSWCPRPRTPRTTRPRTTSAWTSCGRRSTRATAPTSARCATRSARHRGRRRVGVQLPVRRDGPGRRPRRARRGARRRLPRRRVHRRVRPAVPRGARARRPAVGLPRRGRHRDLRRRAQVRLLPEGRVGGAAPRRRLVRSPVLRLRQLGLGPLRLARASPAPSPPAPIATAWTVLHDLGRGRIRRDHAGPARDRRPRPRAASTRPRRRRARRRPDRSGARDALRHRRPRTRSAT